MQNVEILFSRSGAVADALVAMIGAASTSVDAALYRLTNPALTEALLQAARRGVRVRLVLEQSKYVGIPVAREVQGSAGLTSRLLRGRKGGASKMHHKFAVFDRNSIITGSYNWTTESDEENFENLVILRDASAARAYHDEFEALWNEAFTQENA